MAIISLSVKCLEKLIPGYRKFAESFQEDYFGKTFLFCKESTITELVVGREL